MKHTATAMTKSRMVSIFAPEESLLVIALSPRRGEGRLCYRGFPGDY